VDRAPGLSIRLKLTLSYAGFLMLAGGSLLAAVWVFLLTVPSAVHTGRHRRLYCRQLARPRKQLRPRAAAEHARCGGAASGSPGAGQTMP
jgi:hypothetical protein